MIKFETDPIMKRRGYVIIASSVAVMEILGVLSNLSILPYIAGIAGMGIYTFVTGMYFVLYIYKNRTVNFILGILFYIGLISFIEIVLAS